jgi:hypothetical protein
MGYLSPPHPNSRLQQLQLAEALRHLARQLLEKAGPKDPFAVLLVAWISSLFGVWRGMAVLQNSFLGP